MSLKKTIGSEVPSLANSEDNALLSKPSLFKSPRDKLPSLFESPSQSAPEINDRCPKLGASYPKALKSCI